MKSGECRAMHKLDIFLLQFWIIASLSNFHNEWMCSKQSVGVIIKAENWKCKWLRRSQRLTEWLFKLGCVEMAFHLKGLIENWPMRQITILHPPSVSESECVSWAWASPDSQHHPTLVLVHSRYGWVGPIWCPTSCGRGRMVEHGTTPKCGVCSTAEPWTVACCSMPEAGPRRSVPWWGDGWARRYLPRLCGPCLTIWHPEPDFKQVKESKRDMWHVKPK